MTRTATVLTNVGALAERAADVARDRAIELRLPDEVQPRSGEEFEVLVFFSALPEQVYQLRQWYDPLEALARRHPTAVVAKSAQIARTAAAETSLPVRFFRYADPCEQWMTRTGARLVLYVNQNTQNFQALRLAAPAHAHLSHGESEKVSMVSNQLKGYDFVFTAGQAARDRIQQHLVGMDDSRLIDVGHPQIDIPDDIPDVPTDRERTVLYAPTWEGASDGMAYSSLPHDGLAIVRAILSSPDRRLIYRPHPQTGITSRAVRAVDGQIRQLIASTAGRSPGSGHVVDTGRAFGWQLAVADECVCDVSAVAYEWLIGRKPLLIARGSESGVEVGPSIARLPRLPYGHGAEVLTRLDEARATGYDLMAELSLHHFGDTRPGASLRRFLDACTTVIEGRRRALGEPTSPP